MNIISQEAPNVGCAQCLIDFPSNVEEAVKIISTAKECLSNERKIASLDAIVLNGSYD